jgi:hypothetical protein
LAPTALIRDAELSGAACSLDEHRRRTEALLQLAWSQVTPPTRCAPHPLGRTFESTGSTLSTTGGWERALNTLRSRVGAHTPPLTHPTQPSLSSLSHCHAPPQGLTGCNVLPLLRTLAERHRSELTDESRFSRFYRFVFLVARTPGQRNLAVDSALAAWSMCLDSRFPLLERFCAFVRCHRRHVVTEDTWMQARAPSPLPISLSLSLSLSPSSPLRNLARRRRPRVGNCLLLGLRFVVMGLLG